MLLLFQTKNDAGRQHNNLFIRVSLPIFFLLLRILTYLIYVGTLYLHKTTLNANDGEKKKLDYTKAVTPSGL